MNRTLCNPYIMKLSAPANDFACALMRAIKLVKAYLLRVSDWKVQRRVATVVLTIIGWYDAEA